MKKTAHLLIVFVIFAGGVCQAAPRPDGKNSLYVCTSATGGGDGSLDALDLSATGSPNTYDLIDGDLAIVADASAWIFYRMDLSATDTELYPDYIRPDDYSTAGVWVRQTEIGLIPGVDFQTPLVADTDYQTPLDVPSQAEAEAGTATTKRAATAERNFQAVASWFHKNGIKFNGCLDDEPDNEEVLQFQCFTTSFSQNTTGQTVIMQCLSTGTPGVWIPKFGADGTEYISIPRVTSTQITTGTIDILDLRLGYMDNYGQTADAIRTFPAAEGGLDAIFDWADVSNQIIFRPPSGGQLLVIGPTGYTLLSVDEGLRCPAANMTVGDQIIIRSRRTGASTWGYKILLEAMAGTGCVEETP